MRKYVTIFLSLLIALPMFAAGVKKGKKKPLSKTTKLPRISEPIYNNNTLGPNHRFGPKVNYSNRDSDWSSSLIDSSLNEIFHKSFKLKLFRSFSLSVNPAFNSL